MPHKCPMTTSKANAAITGANELRYALRGGCEGTTPVGVMIGSLDKEDVSCSSGSWQLLGKDVRGVPEGNVSIVVRQEDEYRNLGEATLSVTKDVTPPALAVTSSTLMINIANQSSYQGVRGTCEGAQQVMVGVGNAQAQGVACTNSSWSFSVDSALAEGSHGLVVTQADDLGNTSTRNPILVKDVTAPTFAFASNLDINSANKAQYFISGTCGEAGTVTVTVATLNPVTATCDGSNWRTSSAVDASPLQDGQVSVSASMVDTAGNPSASDQTTSVTKDVVSRAVAIGSLDVINSANEATYVVSGSCSSHTGNVSLSFVSGQTVTQTAVCQNRGWTTAAFSVSSLDDGNVAVTAAFGSGQNQVEETGRTVIKDTTAPMITIADNLSAINKANQSSYTVSGTCDENAVTVTVAVGASTARTTTCHSTSWSLSDYDASGITGSSVSITASIQDQYENTRNASAVSVVRDILPPTVTITGASFDINISNETSYALAGTCELGGEAVTVALGGLSEQSLICTTGGVWSLLGFDTSSLVEGTGHSLVVSQEDSAGNVGSVTKSFDKDTTAPTVTITSERKVNSANKGSLTLEGACSENAHKVGVTIGSEAEVEVDCTSLSWTYSSINLSNGASFPEGTIAVSIAHGDKVGNRVTLSDASTQLDKDTTPPTLGVSSNPLPAVNMGNQGAYVLAGNCSGADGKKITISVTGFSGNVQANCEASWTSGSIDLSQLAESARINVIVKVEDGHGNPSQIDTFFVKDVTPPTVTIGTLAEITGTTNLASYAVSGGCSEEGVSVVVRASSVTPTTQPTCSSGMWSTTVNMSALVGQVALSAQQTDAAGNPGNAPGQTLQVKDYSEWYFERGALTVGNGHSCAVTEDKKVLCWGDNRFGQLGNDSYQSSYFPVYVVDGDGSSNHLTDIVEVVGGGAHTCALKGDGKVLCWGKGGSGQLGNGGTENKDYPLYVKEEASTELSNIVQISAGAEHTCVLKESGKVVCWGDDDDGQLGNGASVTADQLYPVYVHEGESSSSHLTKIVQVQVGYRHTCALSSGEQAYCWGKGAEGQLGSSAQTINRSAPVTVLTASGGDPLSGILKIGAGESFSCALLKTGGVKCWGLQSYGRLGNGVILPISVFFPVDVRASTSVGSLSGVVELSSFRNHNCVLVSNGKVQCWGNPSNGELGNGQFGVDAISTGRPVDVLLGQGASTPLSGIIDLSFSGGGSARHICAQHEEGRLLCWGNVGYGQVGAGYYLEGDDLLPGLSHPTTVVDGLRSTIALMKISTLRRTYSCLKGGSSCSAGRAASLIGLKIATGSVGTSSSVTIAVSGVASNQTLTLYDDSVCTSSVGTPLAGNEATQEISVSSLTEGAHKFYFILSEGGGVQVTSCSQNFITYVYDNTPPAELTLTVPNSSGTETTVVVTVSGIEPSHLVKLYDGSDCSAAHLVGTVRSDGISETLKAWSLSVGTHIFRAQATDAAGQTSSCPSVGVSYEVTSL